MPDDAWHVYSKVNCCIVTPKMITVYDESCLSEPVRAT